jgi:hypothetical protein
LTLEKAPDAIYAPKYTVANRFDGNLFGLCGYLLEPSNAFRIEGKKYVNILVFRGTSPDALFKVGVPTEFSADTQYRAVGALALSEVGNQIRNLLEEKIHAFSSTAHLVVTGHSLGGALATRMVAELHVTGRQADLITFESPGIDRASAIKISHNFGQVHRYVTQNDFIADAGEVHPPGDAFVLPSVESPARLTELKKLKANHTTMRLSNSLIDGKGAFKVPDSTSSATILTQPSLESARRMALLLAHII